LLEVCNSATYGGQPTLSPSGESSGLGQQLLAAFALQLRGKLTVGPEGDVYCVRLEFPLQWSESEPQGDDTADAAP